MLSRHFLRAKVLQSVYAANANKLELAVAENNFKHNIFRLNDLGILQLSALVHTVEIAGVMMDEAQHKYLPTEAEKNPNRRLPENIFIQRLVNNYDFRHHCDKRNINWDGVENDTVFRQAFLGFTNLPDYEGFLATEPNFTNDQLFAIGLHRYLTNFEPLRDILCPKSLLWEDDYDQIAQYNYMMLKTLDDTCNETTLIPLMHDDRIEKDAEAYEFAHELLLNTLRHTGEVEALIRKHLKGWEYERVANMDILLLNMAVAELTSCPSIPERVTMDEYIELSKEFSTERSHLFVNGILDRLILELRSEGRIKKTGRGLMDPNTEGLEMN